MQVAKIHTDRMLEVGIHLTSAFGVIVSPSLTLYASTLPDEVTAAVVTLQIVGLLSLAALFRRTKNKKRQ